MTRFNADQIVLVTGAAGDIGRAVARRLASDGASLVLADLPAAASRLDETRRLCEAATSEHGATVAIVPFDVTDAQAVTAAIAEVTATHGPTTLLFNNAGYQGEFANIVDADPIEVERVLAVNVTGVFTVLQAVARSLRDTGRRGAIVNTASMAGVGGAPNMAAYSASKAAVIALTKTAAKDLASLGIRVNSVSPGFIGPGAMWDNQVRRQAEVPSIYYADDVAVVAEQMVNQIPLRRYGSLEEVASIVSFLFSDESSYLTGQNIEISGGAA